MGWASKLREFFLFLHQHSRLGKAITGLDRESAHPSQLHATKRSCCTAAKLGATDQLPTQGDSRPVAPRFAAVQQLHFTGMELQRVC